MTEFLDYLWNVLNVGVWILAWAFMFFMLLFCDYFNDSDSDAE